MGKEELEYLARNEVGSTYGREKIRHKVKRGDVLGKIARKYHVRVADLRAWNKLRGNIIRIGQPLAIWVKTDAFNQTPEDKQFAQVNDKASVPSGKKIHYVQPGDTLWDIARQYPDITIEKIKKMNKLKSNKIKPGQKLVVG